ncbi:hypothetical protein vBKpnMM1_gp227c [Klebsiella phage vB_KpnM_M1]|uniref:Uncharacterized protein n=1 Tax=Klebsiella phage vB_KpnM_M1 TaxID=2798806 RepID=A0A7T8ER51_9CAUD|nr:hypothetical protein vBKpnMM1_gp227c [Klebsiella phage vB_KpnM_M1]QYC51068.1 hypothetical protein [Klebsiella phage vB_KpnM-VAC66]
MLNASAVLFWLFYSHALDRRYIINHPAEGKLHRTAQKSTPIIQHSFIKPLSGTLVFMH